MHGAMEMGSDAWSNGDETPCGESRIGVTLMRDDVLTVVLWGLGDQSGVFPPTLSTVLQTHFCFTSFLTVSRLPHVVSHINAQSFCKDIISPILRVPMNEVHDWLPSFFRPVPPLHKELVFPL